MAAIYFLQQLSNFHLVEFEVLHIYFSNPLQNPILPELYMGLYDRARTTERG